MSEVKKNTRGNTLKYGISAPLQDFYHFNYSRQDVRFLEKNFINLDAITAGLEL